MNINIKYLLLFIPVFAVFCYPIINSGYYGDDSLNSFIGSILAERNLSVYDQYIINFKAFLPTRLSILQSYHWVFLIFASLISYKLYISIILCMGLVSTYLVSKHITKESSVPFLATIFTLLIGIQFREYGDPILVFHGATSISLILLNVSILLFIKYQQSKQSILLVCSLISFAFACLSYEFIYPFCIIYFIISILLGRNNFTQAVKHFCMFFTPVFLIVLPNIISRLLVKVPQNISDLNFHKSYEISLNPSAISVTFIKEIIASLPFSNLILNPFSSLSINNIIFVNAIWILFLASLASLFAVVFYFSLKNSKRHVEVTDRTEFRRNRTLLVIYALMLLVIPNGIIALSPKYQSEIIWGSGYVSLYYGYFGSSILISLALHATLQRFSARWIVFAVSLFLGAGAAANFAANNQTVDVLNTFWKNPRTVAEESLSRGIMADVVSGKAYMFINSNYPWDVTSFIHKYSKKSLNQEQYTGAEGRFFGGKVQENFLISDNEEKINRKFSPKSEQALSKYLIREVGGNYYFDMQLDNNVHYFDYYADSDRGGYALLADVRKAFVSGATIVGLASNRVKVYVRMPEHRGAYGAMSASFLALDPVTLKPIKTLTLQENQVKLISQGRGWKLIEIESDLSQYLIDVKSVRLNTSQKIYQTSLFPEIILDESKLNFKADTKLVKLHLGFSRSFDNSHIAFDPVRLGTEFSIVMRVRSNEKNGSTPFAHIIGNHPGFNNFEGFVVQKKSVGKNVFDFNIGTGKAWNHVFDFTLEPDKDTVIAISVKDGRATTLVDKTVTEINLVSNIRDSGMPLYLGNYAGKDRPFSGQIHELLITSTALSKSTLLTFQKNAGAN